MGSPQWAKERALEEVRKVAPNHCYRVEDVHTTYAPHLIAFARYIAEHEEPPVDSLLIEARRIAYDIRKKTLTTELDGHKTVAANILVGNYDDHQLVVASLTALRRGIELGKQS